MCISLKYFIITFVAQVAVIALALSTEIAGAFVYIFYMVPYALIDAVIPLPAQVGEGMVRLFFFMCLPAIFYSLLFALGVTAIIKIRPLLR